MSVGLQRLREEPDAIRRGAVDKGEDPSIVDAALAADAAPPRAPGRGRRPPRRAQHRLEVDRRIDQGRRQAGRPRGRRRCAPGPPRSAPRLTDIEAELADREAEVEDLLLRIPNPADPDVPVGGEDANVTVRTWGEQLPRVAPLKGEIGADAAPGGETWERKPHWELAESLDIIDNARGAKIAGSGFPVYKGLGARAPASLIMWFLDIHSRDEFGFTEVWPPVVVNEAAPAAPARSRTRKTRCTSSPATTCTWSRRPRSPSRTSTATRSSRRPSCRSATRPTRPASAARPARPARTPAASSASTSSTRSRWSCSRSPRPQPRRSSG